MKDLDFATYDNLEKVTGNSLSDQRNILTINPKYDGRLFDELHDQYVLFYIKLFCSKFKAFILLTSPNNQISEFRIPNIYNQIFVLIFFNDSAHTILGALERNIRAIRPTFDQAKKS